MWFADLSYIHWQFGGRLHLTLNRGLPYWWMPSCYSGKPTHHHVVALLKPILVDILQPASLLQPNFNSTVTSVPLHNGIVWWTLTPWAFFMSCCYTKSATKLGRGRSSTLRTALFPSSLIFWKLFPSFYTR